MTATEKLAGLFGMHPFGFVAVDECRVNFEDLLNAHPGAIVRCFGNPAEIIRFYPTETESLGCVAGWISEDEAA